MVVRCVASPRPPPIWPTITIEVGTVLPLANDRLLVRLIVRACPDGTVMTTGDQPVATGLSFAQVATGAVLVGWTASQL